MEKRKNKYEVFDKVKYSFHNPNKPYEIIVTTSGYQSSGVCFAPLNDFEIKPIVAIKEETITYYDEGDNSSGTYTRYYYRILGKEEWIYEPNLDNV